MLDSSRFNEAARIVNDILDRNRDVCSLECMKQFAKAVEVWCRANIEANKVLAGIDRDISFPLKDYCDALIEAGKRFDDVYAYITALISGAMAMAVHNILLYLSMSSLPPETKVVIANIAVNANRLSPILEKMLSDMLKNFTNRFFGL